MLYGRGSTVRCNFQEQIPKRTKLMKCFQLQTSHSDLSYFSSSVWDTSCDPPPHDPWSTRFQPVRLTDFHLGESWPLYWWMLPGWMDQIKHLLVKFYKTVWLQWVCFVLEVKAFQSEPIETARWFCASISPTPWWSKWRNLWKSHVISRPLSKKKKTTKTSHI